MSRRTLSLNLGTAAPLAPQVLMADGDWKKRHAALITIAQVRGLLSIRQVGRAVLACSLCGGGLSTLVHSAHSCSSCLLPIHPLTSLHPVAPAHRSPRAASRSSSSRPTR